MLHVFLEKNSFIEQRTQNEVNTLWNKSWIHIILNNNWLMKRGKTRLEATLIKLTILFIFGIRSVYIKLIV